MLRRLSRAEKAFSMCLGTQGVMDGEPTVMFLNLWESWGTLLQALQILEEETEDSFLTHSILDGGELRGGAYSCFSYPELWISDPRPCCIPPALDMVLGTHAHHYGFFHFPMLWTLVTFWETGCSCPVAELSPFPFFFWLCNLPISLLL